MILLRERSPWVDPDPDPDLERDWNPASLSLKLPDLKGELTLPAILKADIVILPALLKAVIAIPPAIIEADAVTLLAALKPK